MVEIPVWRNFEDIETSLTLDELLMLSHSASKKQRFQIKLSAMAAGADTSDMDDDEELEPVKAMEETDDPYQKAMWAKMIEREEQHKIKKEQLRIAQEQEQKAEGPGVRVWGIGSNIPDAGIPG